MKHILLLASALFSTFMYSQELVLETKITPNTTYTSHMNINMNGKMDMQGPEEVVNNPQNPFPMDMENQMTMILENTTGSRLEDGRIPGVLEFKKNAAKITVNGTVNETEDPELSAMKIFGHYVGDLEFDLDSVSGKSEVAEAFKESLQSMMGQIQNNIKFPEEPLTIGSKFTQTFPMQMPVAGQVMTMNVVTEFTMTAIKGEEAVFKTTSTMEMNTPVQQGSIDVTGVGKGTMVFNTRLNYYTSYINNMPMKMDIKINEQVRMTADFETLSEITVDIKENSGTASK